MTVKGADVRFDSQVKKLKFLIIYSKTVCFSAASLQFVKHVLDSLVLNKANLGFVALFLSLNAPSDSMKFLYFV